MWRKGDGSAIKLQRRNVRRNSVHLESNFNKMWKYDKNPFVTGKISRGICFKHARYVICLVSHYDWPFFEFLFGLFEIKWTEKWAGWLGNIWVSSFLCITDVSLVTDEVFISNHNANYINFPDKLLRRKMLSVFQITSTQQR